MAIVTPEKTQRESQLPTDWSLADLQRHLGDIPLERIRLYPPPGMATLNNAIHVDAHEDLACELIDGVLVEKTVGWYESMLAAAIVHEILTFVKKRDLGKVLGTDGTLQILPDQMRMPDACFIGWDRFPDGKLPQEPMPRLVPDLAVEVLSESNTKAEMDRKLRDYFQAGVRLVWYVDPKTRTARIFLSPDDLEEIPEDGSLNGGEVLPGLEISLRELFEEADRCRPEPE